MGVGGVFPGVVTVVSVAVETPPGNTTEQVLLVAQVNEPVVPVKEVV